MYGFDIGAAGRLSNPRPDHTDSDSTYTVSSVAEYMSIRAMACPVLEGETVREATEAELAEWFPADPAVWSKLMLKREMTTDGIWDAFCGWLDANPTYRDDWELANDIREDDPVFGQALPLVLAALGKSEEEAEALLAKCVV